MPLMATLLAVVLATSLGAKECNTSRAADRSEVPPPRQRRAASPPSDVVGVRALLWPGVAHGGIGGGRLWGGGAVRHRVVLGPFRPGPARTPCCPRIASEPKSRRSQRSLQASPQMAVFAARVARADAVAGGYFCIQGEATSALWTQGGGGGCAGSLRRPAGSASTLRSSSTCAGPADLLAPPEGRRRAWCLAEGVAHHPGAAPRVVACAREAGAQGLAKDGAGEQGTDARGDRAASGPRGRAAAPKTRGGSRDDAVLQCAKTGGGSVTAVVRETGPRPDVAHVFQALYETSSGGPRVAASRSVVSRCPHDEGPPRVGVSLPKCVPHRCHTTEGRPLTTPCLPCGRCATYSAEADGAVV